MFKNILQNPIERKELVVVKDRTKSKKQQIQEKKKAALKVKKLKQNGDIDEEENKIVEQILKGVNVLLNKSKSDIRMNNHHGQELKKLLDDEMDGINDVPFGHDDNAYIDKIDIIKENQIKSSLLFQEQEQKCLILEEKLQEKSLALEKNENDLTQANKDKNAMMDKVVLLDRTLINS